MESPPLRIVRRQVVADEGPGMLPGATLAANGDLLVSYNTTVDGYAGGEAYLVRSMDMGRTWQRPEPVAQTQRAGATHTTIGMCALPDGAILYPYVDVRHEPDGSRSAVLYVLKSVDNGHHWGKRAPVDIDMSFPVTYGRIIQLGDGTLLCPVDGKGRKEEGSRSGTLRSVDSGETWGDFTTIAYEPAMGGEGGFNETSVIELPDGDLLAILRQEQISPDGRSVLYRSVSSDRGGSWSRYEPTNLCGTSPSLHSTPSGSLVLGYRAYCQSPLLSPTHGVAISWSQDKGMTWHGQLELQDPRGFEYCRELTTPSEHHEAGYPAFVNLPGGEIFVAFHSRCNEPRFQSRFMPRGFSWYVASNTLAETD